MYLVADYQLPLTKTPAPPLSIVGAMLAEALELLLLRLEVSKRIVPRPTPSKPTPAPTVAKFAALFARSLAVTPVWLVQVLPVQ